ncbi:MAG: hypothetical protein GF329_12105 [Candidatus Lokiarchaeota archaeon]|nr:hypothetical protein [Candidatus Lokiarchaeota archaeon]
MDEYYEDLDKYKRKKNYKIISIGIILVVIGYIILIINDLGLFFPENIIITLISLILIHLSPIFLSDLFTHLVNRNIGKVGNALKPFTLLELIFIVISFNLLWFL